MPTINKLNDAQCRAAKPAEKAQKLFDGAGLHLFVSPTGSKTWRLAYRLDGKPKTISFGPYPEVSLAQARLKRDEAKAALRDRLDPMQVKRPTVEKSIALAEAADTYWSGRHDVSQGYRDNALNAIDRHLAPKLGSRSMREITKGDLLECLNVMDAAGRFVYVRKVRMWIGQVFEWAIEQGYADSNPANEIRPEKAFGKKRVRHFVALDARDMPDFLTRLSLEADLNSVIACKLLALLWVRTKELRFMKWPQLEQDFWRLPSSTMKSDEYHLVPLSKQAKALLEQMRERSRGSEYVFSHETRLDRPMSENAILYLIYRIGYKGKMTGHGWRTVASTWANERGYNPDAIERQLAHAPEDETRAAYNRASYLPLRKKMLQDWADWLDSCHPNASIVQRR
ncbi:cp4-like integrase protein [Pusillimonas sp. T7-7]|uniref:tyrosine-type recombinase/integrase n=1 Tax=Pusillimonas sp. (strain T7-7) TaxID=1007105 RepID=UPI000208498F|nr:integrase arm-type DNA-binding domain-containing protein [Pusillimonas sp. T7-7]AEC18756.1 cp4-like integrase protein [Pusillimonas sp. T7-7]